MDQTSQEGTAMLAASWQASLSKAPKSPYSDEAHEGSCSPSAGSASEKAIAAASDLASSPSCRITSSASFPPELGFLRIREEVRKFLFFFPDTEHSRSCSSIFATF